MRRARGFSLIELMISLGLFGLIASGAMSLVMSAVRQQSHSQRVAIAQSGERAGLDFMTRDIMSTSACANSGALANGATGALILPITVTNSATGPDTLDVYLVKSNTMATLLAAAAPATTTLSVDTASQFPNGSMIQLCDCANGILASVNSTGTGGGTGTISLASTNIFPVQPTFPNTVTSFPAGSLVFTSRHATYAINAVNVSATSNESMLTLDLHDGNGPQPLAEGVEDFQVALGFDLNSDGNITEVGNAAGDDEWVFNYPGEVAPLTLANLKQVRITVVSKSVTAETGAFPARPKAEDHPAGTSDNFFRRVMQTNIAVRNFNL